MLEQAAVCKRWRISLARPWTSEQSCPCLSAKACDSERSVATSACSHLQEQNSSSESPPPPLRAEVLHTPSLELAAPWKSLIDAMVDGVSIGLVPWHCSQLPTRLCNTGDGVENCGSASAVCGNAGTTEADTKHGEKDSGTGQSVLTRETAVLAAPAATNGSCCPPVAGGLPACGSHSMVHMCHKANARDNSRKSARRMVATTDLYRRGDGTLAIRNCCCTALGDEHPDSPASEEALLAPSHLTSMRTWSVATGSAVSRTQPAAAPTSQPRALVAVALSELLACAIVAASSRSGLSMPGPRQYQRYKNNRSVALWSRSRLASTARCMMPWRRLRSWMSTSCAASAINAHHA
mmetsp:Transcript_15690/g.44992  ORF Transcript_15690/g.44992 Transcript_15690/m.44992 type:complete len:351 (-) Transcript_15690:2723-3775(-)